MLSCIACTTPAPHPPALRVPAKAAKKAVPAPVPEEFDDSFYTPSPSVLRRNLPLAGTRWEWEGSLSGGGFDGLADSSRYNLEFKPNGWFEVQADGRHGMGIYEVNGQRLALAVIKSFGPPHPEADDFLRALELARFFRRAEGKLYFDLKRGAKTMIFAPKP